MPKESQNTPLNQEHFAKGKYLRKRMDRWLEVTLPACVERDTALAVITQAESGIDFIKSVHQECGSHVSTVVAQNCGKWATEVIGEMSDIDRAKALLSSLVFGEYSGYKDWQGKFKKFEPLVFSAAHGLHIIRLEVTVAASSDWDDIHWDFCPPHHLWNAADQLGRAWFEAHKNLNTVSYSSIDNFIEEHVRGDPDLFKSIKRKMFKTVGTGKSKRLRHIMECAHIDWDLRSNRIVLLPISY